MLLNVFVATPGRGRIDPPQIKESPHKRSPICSTTHHACMLNPCLDYPYMLTHYAIWERRIDPPQIGKEKKDHASNCLYAQPPSL